MRKTGVMSSFSGAGAPRHLYPHITHPDMPCKRKGLCVDAPPVSASFPAPDNSRKNTGWGKLGYSVQQGRENHAYGRYFVPPFPINTRITGSLYTMCPISNPRFCTYLYISRRNRCIYWRFLLHGNTCFCILYAPRGVPSKKGLFWQIVDTSI